MSPRVVIALAVGGFLSFAAGVGVWILIQPDASAEAVSAMPAQPASGAARQTQREQFFGGDPDRDVRGGQEMKPRW